MPGSSHSLWQVRHDVTSAPRQLPRLTSLRALAALGIFAFHLPRIMPWALGGQTASHAYVGVAFFFILSGFVLAWSTPDGPLDARRFFLRRIARLYPSHLAMLALALIAPVTAQPLTWAGGLASATLTQAWFPQWTISFSLNAVSWALSCEMFLYLLTPWLLTRLRPLPVARMLAICGSTWLACFAVGGGLVHADYDVWAYTLPPLRVGEFLLGIALAEVLRRSVRSHQVIRIPVTVATLAVVVSYVATLKLTNSQFLSGSLMVPAFALIIYAAATTDIAGYSRGVLRSPLLERAGAMSFCFYLVHELFLFNIAPYLPERMPSRLAALVAQVLLLVACYVLGTLLHAAVERPAQRWVLRWGYRTLGVETQPRRAGSLHSHSAATAASCDEQTLRGED